MADMLLSPLIKIVVQKSGDLLVQRISQMWGIDDQRKTLKEKLLAIQDVLIDAEEQGDAKPSVKSWLAKLKSAAYDADDVLDEFRYEELRRDAVRRGHKAGNVSGFFSLENPILFRFKMSRKLKEIVGRIDELVTEMERFKFVQGRQGRVVDRDRTHSYVIELEVVGREDDKDKLVKLLTEVHPTENLTVLPVVGMGGLGKTTLAQLAYSDPRIKEHFKLLVWVCVSDEFDVALLAKSIIDSIVQVDCNVPRNNMELLQIRLRQEISGKRYLLVMDDVWNDNQSKWEQLSALLKCGDLGSTVLVTTRDARVASIMGTVPSYNLECLGEEDSWSMFQKRAFCKGVKENPQLVGIGRKLVKNCGGLPLAIKTLGSLMSCKDEIRQWLAILEQSTVWENKHANDNDGVMPILRLSYNHLPSYMKQCFAFCAVFPKDHVMYKENLVQYWMAHGFIPSNESGDLEMTGSDIFNELVWRSFFQEVERVVRDKDGNIIGHRWPSPYKMHDLMHDMAQSVMRDECVSLREPLQIRNNLQCNMRHIFLKQIFKDINDVIQCYPVARTLINQDHCTSYVQKIGFVKSNFLRVLTLPKCVFKDTMITHGKMKHLRYLDLSDLQMATLPETITTLYLLQTLRFSNCYRLLELPKGMRYMMSLRHLHIEDLELKSTPPGLGELKFLQTLRYYIVGTNVGNKIVELKTLNLRGQLEVYNLGEVGNAREAREVNMESKQNLDHLLLSWGTRKNYLEGVRCNDSEAVVIDLEVLDALKPCNNLKVLEIREYRGDKFPIWMNEYQMLENLVELYIIKCRRCVNLPPFYRLPLLETLSLRCMDDLKHFCCGVFTNAEGGEDALITFPSLKYLYLYDLPNLDFWCEGDIGEKTSLFFPVLSDMLIYNCLKLSALPITPKLEEMKIEGNKTLSNLATGITNVRRLTLDISERKNNGEETLSFKSWVSLEELTIEGFNHIIPPKDEREGAKLSAEFNATALRKLNIGSNNFWFSSIPSSAPIWWWKCFTFLEFLYINDCDSLTSWPEEELSNLNCLRIMEVSSCKNFLQSRSKPPPKMSSRQTLLLPKLESLTIKSCPNMVEVPKLPRSLKKLKIIGSTKLESLPEWLGSLESLKELIIGYCESLNLFPSSIEGLTAIQMLNIYGCKKLESLPEQLGSLVALQTLHIGICNSLNSLPSSIGDLTAIQILKIYGCKKLESLPEQLGSLVALQTLYILKCESLNSLPSSIGNLTALENLTISECMNLASLPEGLQGLEALKSLKILHCPKIRTLPESLLQRLRSLDELEINGCSLLERDFRKHGRYGHLISEIPKVMIGEEGRSSKIGDLTRLISSCKISCLSAQS